LIQASHFGEGV